MNEQYKVGQWVELTRRIIGAKAGARGQIIAVDTNDRQAPIRVQLPTRCSWLLEDGFKLVEAEQYKVGQWVELTKRVLRAGAGTRWQIVETDDEPGEVMPVRVILDGIPRWLEETEFKLVDEFNLVDEHKPAQDTDSLIYENIQLRRKLIVLEATQDKQERERTALQQRLDAVEDERLALQQRFDANEAVITGRVNAMYPAGIGSGESTSEY